MLKDFLFRLLRPRYWFMGNSYNAEWDAFILDAIAGDKFTEVGEYTAKVGNVDVWITNHPYASFCPYNTAVDCRPSCRTIDLAHRYLVRKIMGGK